MVPIRSSSCPPAGPGSESRTCSSWRRWSRRRAEGT